MFTLKSVEGVWTSIHLYFDIRLSEIWIAPVLTVTEWDASYCSLGYVSILPISISCNLDNLDV